MSRIERIELNNKNWQSDYPTYVIKHREKKHAAVTWVLHSGRAVFHSAVHGKAESELKTSVIDFVSVKISLLG